MVEEVDSRKEMGDSDMVPRTANIKIDPEVSSQVMDKITSHNDGIRLREFAAELGLTWQKLLPVLSFAIFPILRLFGFTETREIITKRLSSQIVPVIKLYTLPEAQNILAANNFKIIKLFGSVAAQGWSSDFGIKAQKIIKKTNSN